MARYLLYPDSYVCIADRHAPFLDLTGDKYTAPAPKDALLRTLVRGWLDTDKSTGSSTRRPPNHAVTDLLRMLVQEGLLTESEVSGKPSAPVDVIPATLDIFEHSAPMPRVAPTDVLKFVQAWAHITVALNFLPVMHTVRGVRRRRRLKRSLNTSDLGKAKRLMVPYLILRPNFLSEEGSVLRESRMFVGFYGFYPRCAFGVKSSPLPLTPGPSQIASP